MKKVTNDFLKIMHSRILGLRTLFKNKKRNEASFAKVRVNSGWRRRESDER